MSAPGQEQPVEGAPTSTAPETAAPSFDMSPVLDRVNELAGSIDTRFGAIEQRLPAPPEAPAEADPWAALFADPQDPNAGFEQYGQPAPQQPQMDPQAFQAAVNQAIQQQNAPLMAQLQEMQVERATQQLYAEIPQLAPVPSTHPNFQANQEARQQTAQLVQTSLQGYSPEIAGALAADPKYIATIFKAAEAEKLAQGQAPAGGQPPSLEAAGGALPGGNSEPVNPVHQAYGGTPQGLAKGFR